MQQSLAKDLERFLNHQPLAYGRQSVAERAFKKLLDAAASPSVKCSIFRSGCACSCSHGGPRPYPATEWLWPRPLSRLEFHSAVAAIERGDDVEAAKNTTRVVTDFPRSCLARFYLAFALTDEPEE